MQIFNVAIRGTYERERDIYMGLRLFKIIIRPQIVNVCELMSLNYNSQT